MGSKKKETKEKPLEKMTAKELREVADKIPEVTGIHGMNKAELVSDIKKARGIEEKPRKTTSSSTRELKQKIKVLKEKRKSALESKDKKSSVICRKKISKLKRQTRKAA